MLGGMAEGQKSGNDDLVKIIVSVIYLFSGKNCSWTLHLDSLLPDLSPAFNNCLTIEIYHLLRLKDLKLH